MEVYEVYWPPSPVFGWGLIVLGIVFGILGWKKRLLLGAAIAILSGCAFLLLGVHDRYFFLAFALVLVGAFVDLVRSKQFKESSTASKAVSTTCILIVVVYSGLLRYEPVATRIELLPGSLDRQSGVTLIARESLDKGELTATLIHVEGWGFDEWRFREKAMARR